MSRLYQVRPEFSSELEHLFLTCAQAQTHGAAERPRCHGDRGWSAPDSKELSEVGVTGWVMWSSGTDDPSQGNAIKYGLTSFFLHVSFTLILANHANNMTEFSRWILFSSARVFTANYS